MDIIEVKANEMDIRISKDILEHEGLFLKLAKDFNLNNESTIEINIKVKAPVKSKDKMGDAIFGYPNCNADECCGCHNVACAIHQRNEATL